MNKIQTTEKSDSLLNESEISKKTENSVEYKE